MMYTKVYSYSIDGYLLTDYQYSVQRWIRNITKLNTNDDIGAWNLI